MKLALRFMGAGERNRRGSVFLISVFVVMIAAVVVTSWLAFITESHRLANRDRARVHAFMAAEAGLEMAVDWFNHAGYFDEVSHYPGAVPDAYLEAGLQNYAYNGNYPCEDFEGYEFGLFEPYVLSVRKDGKFDTSGPLPIWNEYVVRDEMGRPVRTLVSWFTKAGQSKIPTCELKRDKDEDVPWLVFEENGEPRATLSRIVVINPADFESLGEPAAASSSRIICKVIAEGTAPELDGATVRVEALIRENPLLMIASPGAIITGKAAEYNGQYNVHWGELWAQKTIELPSNFDGKIIKPKDDPWFRVRTTEYLMQGGEYANGHDLSDGFSPTPITDTSDVNYYTVYQQVDSDKLKKLPPYRNLLQHQDLLLPRYDYDLVKDFFTTMELPYYYTDTDGMVVGIENGEWVKHEFSYWFHKDPASADYWDEDQLVVMIDSVPVDDNGNIERDPETGIPMITETCYPRGPNDPNALFATISEQGSGLHTRGAFFLNTDIAFNGAGAAPNANSITKDGQTYVVDPEGKTANNLRVSHNGLLYSWGKLENSANRTVYGSIFAEGGFGAGGGPDVYYNYRMKDGSWLDISNSAVMRMGWRVRTEPIPDINEG